MRRFDGCLPTAHGRNFWDFMGWFKDRAGRAWPRNSYWLVPPCSHFLWLSVLVLQLVFIHGSQILAGWGSVSPHFVVSHLAKLTPNSWKGCLPESGMKDLQFPYFFPAKHIKHHDFLSMLPSTNPSKKSTKNHLIVPDMVEGYEKLDVYTIDR